MSATRATASAPSRRRGIAARLRVAARRLRHAAEVRRIAGGHARGRRRRPAAGLPDDRLAKRLGAGDPDGDTGRHRCSALHRRADRRNRAARPDRCTAAARRRSRSRPSTGSPRWATAPVPARRSTCRRCSAASRRRGTETADEEVEEPEAPGPAGVQATGHRCTVSRCCSRRRRCPDHLGRAAVPAEADGTERPC